MPKINQEEYEILKQLDDKWKWIARDEDGRVWVYNYKPTRREKVWESGGGLLRALNSDLFRFIKWEDEEPYSVKELINEYEEAKRINKLFRDGLHKALDEVHKSEETEVKKDIELLKREIHKELESWHGVDGGIDGDGINKIILLIDQLDEPKPLLSGKNELRNQVGRLINDRYGKPDEKSRIERQAYLNVHNLIDKMDEPEVLSPKWVDDNAVLGQYPNGMGNVVPVGKLYGKLLPKQELPVAPEKVVVPKWFAEWYESKGHDMSLYGAFKNLYTYHKQRMGKWADQYEMGHAELQEDLTSIFKIGRDGYTVEEKNYCVKMGNVYFKREFEFTAWKDKAWVFSEKGDAEEEARQLGGTVEEMSE